MKPGSKALEKQIRKFYFVSRGMAALAILLLLLQQLIGMNLHASFFGILGFGSLGVFYILAAFSPVYENPRWELVFPELRKK
jgi:hypothetical protein